LHEHRVLIILYKNTVNVEKLHQRNEGRKNFGLDKLLSVDVSKMHDCFSELHLNKLLKLLIASKPQMVFSNPFEYADSACQLPPASIAYRPPCPDRAAMDDSYISLV
jgi:hypothetical protein